MSWKVQKYLENAVEKSIFPGCCVFVKHLDQTDYYCVGNRQTFPYKVVNNYDTIYDIASLSKVVVTTTIILFLIQEKKLTLETTVSSILEKFKHTHITIQDLLIHTSGLQADYKVDKSMTKEELIQDIYFIDLEYETGEKVVYSDLGYILLGEIIEVMMKDSLNNVAQKMIFNPLDMSQSCYNPTVQLKCAPTEYIVSRRELKHGYVHDEKCNILGGVAGHAGVFMTIYDLEKYVCMLMEGKMLSTDSLDLLTTNLAPAGCIKRGVGYLVKDDESPFPKLCSQKSILHTGFTGTSLFVDFKNNIAIGVLSNRIHPTRQNNQIISWRKEFHEFVFNAYILE